MLQGSPTSELEVGVVTRPHGLTGEVRVKLHWIGSTSLNEASHVWLHSNRERQRFAVAGVRRASQAVLLSLVGVTTREAAEALRGARIFVDRSELPALAEDEYYLTDLVGAQVLAPDGPVGEVVEVATYPSVDSLIIRTLAGDTVEQPLVEPWVEKVDLAGRCVMLSSREGLIE